MSRGVIAFDRVAAFLVGAVVIISGVFAVVWWRDFFSWLPSSITTRPCRE